MVMQPVKNILGPNDIFGTAELFVRVSAAEARGVEVVHTDNQH